MKMGFNVTGTSKGFRLANSSRVLVIKCPKVMMEKCKRIISHCFVAEKSCRALGEDNTRQSRERSRQGPDQFC